MDYKKFFHTTVFTIAVICFFGFFLIFTQIFSGNLEDFFIWRVTFDKNSFLASAQNAIPINLLPARNWDKNDFDSQTESAISVNVKSGYEKILFKKNENARLSIASLTKLMTALLVVENFDLKEKITIDKESVAQEENGFLKESTVFFANDLLKDMLIESNNVAGNAFAQTYNRDNFINLMNEKAEKIGMDNTIFGDPTGIADLNYSTAKDIVKLVKYIKQNYPEIFEITKNPEFDLYQSGGVFNHKAINTNKLLSDHDVSDKILGGKTGYNLEAGECLILLLASPNNQGYLINVILKSKDRFSDMKNLIEWEELAYHW